VGLPVHVPQSGVSCHHPGMRLHPGITFPHAEDVLRRAETTWLNARGARGVYHAYTSAVHDTVGPLREVFADPDLAAGMYSTAYWNLLSIGDVPPEIALSGDPAVLQAAAPGRRARNLAVAAEIENQVKALERAKTGFEALKELAARPGLPVVYDTNMLNHWTQPGDIPWRAVFKNLGEDVPHTRLVVPLRVVDELDRQKYGPSGSDLGKKAATAIRYLERTLDGPPGRPVRLREGVTLEVWNDTDDRAGDADLSILRCAADLQSLHPDTRVRVLTGDFGMRLRARQMGLETLRLPEEHRKRGTACDDV